MREVLETTIPLIAKMRNDLQLEQMANSAADAKKPAIEAKAPAPEQEPSPAPAPAPATEASIVLSKTADKKYSPWSVVEGHRLFALFWCRV